MQIELTNTEYKQLLDALVIAHMTRYSFSPEGPSDTAPDEMLMQKILSYAAVFGAGEEVEFYPDLGRAYVTQQYVDTSDVHEVISSFEDQVFWDQLVGRLTERDMVRTFGELKIEEMDEDEEEEQVGAIESSYWDVFETRGVDAVSVDGVGS